MLSKDVTHRGGKASADFPWEEMSWEVAGSDTSHWGKSPVLHPSYTTCSSHDDTFW